MPKKPPKNSNWVQLTRDFVKEWPEVLEGLHFQNMPVKYLHSVNLVLKNNITIHYDVKKEIRFKKQEVVAKFLKKTIKSYYSKIKHVDLKFDVDALKKDMEQKTNNVLSKTFKQK
tara:strand:+ start:1336 stop:1680 length:345 start_codon:yes stop_codon:yes gene_type:complete